MLEAEATADMLLMTQPFTASPIVEATEQPVEVLLVSAVLSGERDRFARLYEMYAPMVHGETVEVTEQMAVERPPNRTAKEILDMICRLPEAYRETLVLRFVEGMTGPEIAARTGLTPASVRVNLHRGMKMLREKIGAVAGQ